MPTIGTSSKPAYVYDAGTDTWIPIGPGEHTHAYVEKSTLTTTGDLIYASAANTPARLGIGSTDQVLTVSGGVPTWATPAGGGKILQVVIDTNTTTEVFSSTSFVDSALSLSITPASASNKVLIMLASPSWKSPDTAGGGDVRLLRDSTVLATMFGLGAENTVNRERETAVMNYLDTPSTTSAITYKIQARTIASPGEWRMSNGGSFSSLIAMEVAG